MGSAFDVCLLFVYQPYLLNSLLVNSVIFYGSSTCIVEASQISSFEEPHVPFKRGPSPELKGAKSSHYWKKGCLVCQLKAATHPQKGITSRLFKTQVITRANTRIRSTRWTTSAYHELEPVTVQAPEAVLSFKDSEEEPVETCSNLDDPLVEDFKETTQNTGNSFTPAQITTIESTVQSFSDRTLQSFSISVNLPLVVSHLLTVAQALVSQKSNSSGLASSIREEFQRKHLTGWVHWFHFVTPWFPYSNPGPRFTIAVGWLLPRFPLLPSVHGAEKKTSDWYISQMAGRLYDLQAGNCCRISLVFRWTSKISADY